VNRNTLLCLPYLLIVVAACSPEPDPGELCEQPATETGDVGAFGSEIVGLEDLGFEVQRVGHHPRIGIREPELDGPPTIPIDFGDGREPVTSPEELESYPLQTVVQIVKEIPNEIGGIYRGTATGFLVGPRHVLTNHHVAVDDNDGDINPLIEMSPMNFSFQVYPGRAKDADLNGGPWNVERVVWGPNAWNGLYWGGEDYALLILEDDPNRSGVLGRMGMCSPTDNTIEGLSVYTAGYPGDSYQCANSPDPEGYCDGWMYKQECSVIDQHLYPTEFGHDCTTIEGQSGSPLWVAECDPSPAVCAVGLHSGPLGSEERAKRLDPATVNYLRQAICASGSDFAPSPSFCD
jgi:V8-like Glu-specific endopeptidase